MKVCYGFAALLLGGAALMGSARALERQPITVGSSAFQVEVARTPEERERGLMFRQELASNRGMLFVQPTPGPAVFWMKNTFIALDLLYFDSTGRLLQIVTEAPPCKTLNCPLYPSNTATVKYILEINAGQAVQRGIHIGDQLRLE
ncbi:MAG: DUF192 domain-containing protein [Candidatus Competibacteraceae bacterium]